jgi:hypothetical protein
MAMRLKTMNNVVQLGGKKIFTIESANALLKTIHSITHNTRLDVNTTLSLLQAAGADTPRGHVLEASINSLILTWQTKMEKLGVEPKGLWLVDFDSGSGYFCWKYPETVVEHFHSYTEGMQSRRKVES